MLNGLRQTSWGHTHTHLVTHSDQQNGGIATSMSNKMRMLMHFSKPTVWWKFEPRSRSAANKASPWQCKWYLLAHIPRAPAGECSLSFGILHRKNLRQTVKEKQLFYDGPGFSGSDKEKTMPNWKIPDTIATIDAQRATNIPQSTTSNTSNLLSVLDCSAANHNMCVFLNISEYTKAHAVSDAHLPNHMNSPKKLSHRYSHSCSCSIIIRRKHVFQSSYLSASDTYHFKLVWGEARSTWCKVGEGSKLYVFGQPLDLPFCAPKPIQFPSITQTFRWILDRSWWWWIPPVRLSSCLIMSCNPESSWVQFCFQTSPNEALCFKPRKKLKNS